MNNIQETLLFPVHDSEARKQFLITCLIMLASFVIPILPMFVVMGYGVKIMRQIIDERKDPSMPNWQGIDWSETFLDGVKLYGVQLVYTLPLFLFLGAGIISMMVGSFSVAALSDESTRSFAPVGGIFFIIGIGLFMLFSLISLPYGIIISAVGPHVATKRSFAAGFEFKEWWQFFRKAIGQFLLAYAMTMVVSFVFIIIMQIAMITLVLMCIVPFIMIPYSAYLTLMTNTLYAQAYLAGRDALQVETQNTITESA